jgi:triacylglycerol lipase
MKTPLYTIEQRIMALNWFSNLASLKTGKAADLQAGMKQNILDLFKDQTIIDMIGEWSLEWGPVVVEEGIDKTTRFSTNAMYVAKQKNYNGKNDHYVIAIAGTNAFSFYGWIVEDFKTNTMVLWKDAGTNTNVTIPYVNRCADAGAQDPSAPRVSKGTCIGLQVLLDMKSPVVLGEKKSLLKTTEVLSEGISLLKFLENHFGVQNAPMDLLTVTGHSLGGALCSALTLRLAERQLDSPGVSGWNPSHTVDLTAMPTAGPSAGNQAFSDYYNNTLGLKTTRVWNSMDPVPCGHEPSMLQYVPHLYYPYILPDAGLYSAAALLLKNSYAGTAPTQKEGGFYTQIMPQVASLHGSYNSEFTPLPPGTLLQFGVDYFYPRVLEAAGFSPLKIKEIMFAINTILKIQKWTGHEGAIIDFIIKEIGKLFGDSGKLMEIVKFLLHNTSAIGAFLQQLGYQHVWAYADLLKMEGFKKAVDAVTKDHQPSDLFEWILQNEPEMLAKFFHKIFHTNLLREKGLV